MFKYKLAHVLFDILVKIAFSQDSPELPSLMEEAREAYASWSSSEDWEEDGACPVCGCVCNGTCEGAVERRMAAKGE